MAAVCLFGILSSESDAAINLSLNRPVSGIGFVDAFPGLHFDQPVGIISAPGETNRLFIIERKGVISVITNLANPTRSVFLDIRSSVWSDYEEAGLLGLAFHPGFATNGQFFVYRTRMDLRLRDELVRYTASSGDPNRADQNSELIFISQFDNSQYHNGGGLAFGPDGFLYYSIGEGSPWKDNESPYPINIDKGFFGVVLRIDVDKRPSSLPPNVGPGYSTNYAIPFDNPFIGATNFMERAVDPQKIRTEIYAVGFRNPFRISFDFVTGELFLGDVGEGTTEEIDLIKPGANYGWPYYEGNAATSEEPPVFDAAMPLYAIGHGSAGNDVGCAIVGGIVSRNGDIPSLEGAYVFGDFVSGNVWKLTRSDSATNVDWIGREMALSAFGRDPATGSILVANVGTGLIRRMIECSPANSDVPTLLSQTGLFKDLQTLDPADGVFPFEINVPFWSDYAVKRRWFGFTTTNHTIGFSPEGNWDFPDGSFWVKHFDLQLIRGDTNSIRRIETRVLIKKDDDVFGYTYRWGESNSDAELVPNEGLNEKIDITEDGVTRTQSWRYPGRGECHSCHSKAGGFALGFNTRQLNKDVQRDGVTRNQLQWLASVGCLDKSDLDPSTLRRLAPASDTTQPIHYRAKSLLDANCSACHQPEGPALRMRWDARASTPMSQSGLIDSIPVIIGYGTNECVIKPAEPLNSVLIERLSFFDTTMIHMPPFGTFETNHSALDLLTNWVNGLDRQWSITEQIGTGPLEGGVHSKTNSQVVGATGQGLDDQFFAGTPISGNAQIIAHIASIPGATPWMLAGPAIRGGMEAGNSAAWLAYSRTAAELNFRGSSNGIPMALRNPETQPSTWFRLVRSGQRIVAWESANGSVWKLLACETLDLPDTALFGLAVASGDPWRYATVEFDHIQTLAINLNVYDPNPSKLLPKPIALSSTIATNGSGVRQIDYFADGNLIASLPAENSTFTWTNAWAGEYDVVAVAKDLNGLSLTSAPVRLNLQKAPSIAQSQSSQVPDGSWTNGFGAVDWIIPTAPVTNTRFNVESATVAWFPQSALLPGLDNLNGGSFKTAWIDPGTIDIQYVPPTELPYRLSLFFADYSGPVSEQVRIYDRDSGSILSKRDISSAGSGEFFVWIARGAIRIEVQSLVGGSASLSGCFADPITPPTVQLHVPVEEITTPAALLLTADASAEGRGIRSVQFCDGNVVLAERTSAPYQFLWTNILAGDHILFARAIGEFGFNADSPQVTLHARFPTAQATFIGMDSMTQGDWQSAYGDDGFALLGISTNLPPELPFNLKGEPYFWSVDTTDPSGLRYWNLDGRYIGVYYGPSYSLHLTNSLLDGLSRHIALYFVDDPRISRREIIRARDAETGAILDERVAEQFSAGIYFVYDIRGKVQFEFEPLDSWEPVLSAFFFGGAVRPSSVWRWTRYPGAGPEVWASDPDGDGRANLLEYIGNTDPQSADSQLIKSIVVDADSIVVDVNISIAANDATVSLESSNDFVTWSIVPTTAETIDGGIRFRVPLQGGNSYFRLRGDLTSGQ